jgi:hypothetical protein
MKPLIACIIALVLKIYYGIQANDVCKTTDVKRFG